jgi:hypothetical protein
MRQRQFGIDTEQRLRQAIADILGRNPYSTLTAISAWSGVAYATAKAWVEREEAAGRLSVTPDGNGYRIEVVR